MPDSAIAKRFSQNLAREIEKSSLSRREVALRSEIHPVQLGRLLRGRQTPKVDTLLKLAGALQIPPAALLEGMSYSP